MTPLKPAIIPEEEQSALVSTLYQRWNAGDPLVLDAFKTTDAALVPGMIRAYVKDAAGEHWRNELYQVAVRRQDGQVHLSIKRNDRQPCKDWRHFQQIKNQLVGPECEGVELYPAESRLVDTANQFHIWCSIDPAFRFPFGFEGRFVSETPLGKSINRPLK